MHDKITYTFPLDCKIAKLRGITVSGGEFCRIDGTWQGTPDAVRFVESIEGKTIMASITGKPELEAALAAHQTFQQTTKDRLSAIGWTQYQAAQHRAYNARIAYDHASERGYPVREAAEMRKADAALAAARAQYPMAAAYAKAESYSMAHNDQKASAGRRAMIAIESGADPIATIATMEAEWHAAAEKAVQNA
jgi:hypothetical protein